ncbi:hypothetical protein GobsT_63490 [Gemmata obscuriglobus]|uniref:Uncharacterized protein n=1 Tax=Gemmata obscuriglobus TaxID=114 RepID=A0A2Z3GNU6_9BACT|nr:hypothetical protein [Gemmata obscuriglobus]AWM35919.1 hypothetical protein C1280_02090 [Gemmata obscuriglobus]QEG31527.1 hypothetical protein GobsT_63490 [Gemmata obscuriglobus]VTS10869.1 unnamed protein product [Gemmata obscuriglobus UQM 2246]
MQADDEAFCALVRRVQGNLDRGLLCEEEDHEALSERLRGCETVADVEALQRTALRWNYATRPLDPWDDWQSTLDTTRN